MSVAHGDICAAFAIVSLHILTRIPSRHPCMELVGERVGIKMEGYWKVVSGGRKVGSVLVVFLVAGVLG